MPRSTLFTIAGALALGVTVAHGAAPSPAGGTPTPVAECKTPDEELCLKKGYLDSACGKKHVATCKPFVKDALQAYHDETDGPAMKMLRPLRSEMPRDVQSGKYFHYTQPSLAKSGHSQYRSAYRKLGDPLRGLQGRDMSAEAPVDRATHVDPAVAADAHRKPEWMKPSVWEVRSCDEYAYERSYGITRFIDAASACRGDFECVFDVAYMPTTPGIANVVLRTSDGNALPQKIELFKGTRPKNEMFVYGGEFVRSDGLDALPDMEVHTELESVLDSGKEYYKIGSCGGACTEPRKFKNEWDWHEFLHEKVATVSQAENEEYMRRLAEFRNLIDQWNAAVTWEKSLGEQLPEDEHVIVTPLDMRAQDPFDLTVIEREYIERGRETVQSLKKKYGKSITTKSMPAIRALAKEKFGSLRAPTSTPAGVLASPAPVPAEKPAAKAAGVHGGGMVHTATTTDNAVSRCIKDPDEWGLESAYKGPISCRIGEFLQAEWKRKKEGHLSCLDLGNFACDWTPQMFQASVLDQIPALDQQLSDREYCKAWDSANTFASPTPSVKTVKERLDANKSALEDIKQVIEPYDLGNAANGRRLGKNWQGGDYLGNKNWFAVGYDYDVGWSAQPEARSGDGFVCALSGGAHADTGFDAWIIGNKVPVVDGQVAGRANNGGDGQLKFQAHLEMMDQTVFSTGRDDSGNPKWKVAQTFGDDPQSGFMIDVPPFKPRFDIYVGVPISGQMWGELMFGSQLSLAGQAQASCDANNPKFGVVASYGPLFGAWGLGQVGVGIAGVASAGIRAALNLIMIHLPVGFDMQTIVKDNPKTQGHDDTAYLRFSSNLGLTLSTLSGRVSLYIEFIGFDEEFELFRWKGFGPTTATLMPLLSADVPMIGFDRQ